MTPLEMVTEFHTVFNHPILTRPTLPADRVEFRVGFIVEEVREFGEAAADNHAVGMLDALGDIAYVVIGAALEFGMPFATSPLLPAEAFKPMWSSLEAEGQTLRRRAIRLRGYAASEDLRATQAVLLHIYYDVIEIANDYGFPLDEAMIEIHRSNMAKREPDGTINRRGDGKVLKPLGWTPPDLEKIMLQHARQALAA